MEVRRSSADTRHKILEVAEQEFALGGYAGTHLELIASQVGVQKTALYYYFPSKAALYEAVFVRMVESLDQAVAEVLQRQEPPEARLERFLATVNDLLAEHHSYSKILIRIFVDQVELPSDALNVVTERLVRRLLSFYREGIDTGAFARLSPRHFFQTILGAVVFHYGTSSFGAAVLGVDDIFEPGAVAWRREQLRRFVLRAVLTAQPASAESQAGQGERRPEPNA
jgi:TetR/AcrR family transcriptional regulator